MLVEMKKGPDMDILVERRRNDTSNYIHKGSNTYEMRYYQQKQLSKIKDKSLNKESIET
jgi:hypothetical protein